MRSIAEVHCVALGISGISPCECSIPIGISKLLSKWKHCCTVSKPVARCRWIVEQAAALDFKNYIHLIDTDIYRSRYLKEYIHPSVSIYYRRDYVIGEAYWRRHGTRLEPELAASADLVLANSTRFAAELQAYNPHTYPIETGVNLKLYNPAKK